jgi:hypothetical protein
MMRRLLTIFALLVFAPAIWAQDISNPFVESELEETTAIPGQELTLRLTVLVPTWLLKPVEFPSLELPNLRVRLTERSTTPLSRNIDGVQWSGVSRSYLLTPMVPGQFVIPPRELIVNYADPATTSPITASVMTEAIAISGLLPDGAEGLDPFIAAKSLTLAQDLSGGTADLKPGDSVTRTITATIEGGSPLVLPPLQPEVFVAGVRPYPDEPVVTETDDRGTLSGTRVETVTLMAEGGGSGAVEGIELRWFNLESGEVETASIDGFEISVSGPPATASRTREWNLPLILGALAALAIAGLLIRWLLPRLTAYLRRRQENWLASEAWAEGQLQKAIGAKDYPLTVKRLGLWLDRQPQLAQEKRAEITSALTVLGAHLYGPTPTKAPAAAWNALAKAVRASDVRLPQQAAGLPPLNPGRAV